MSRDDVTPESEAGQYYYDGAAPDDVFEPQTAEHFNSSRSLSQYSALAPGEHTAPSIAEARKHAIKAIWKQGRSPVLKTSVGEMGGLGIGFQLYFTLLDQLSLLILALSVLALPALFANVGGSNMQATELDALSFSLLTLGNQGTHCEGGASGGPRKATLFGSCDIDCDDNTKRCILGSSWNSSDVAYLMCTCEVVASLLILYYIDFVIPRTIEKFRRIRDSTAPSVTRYAVLVKGLPPDATQAEVSDFFSANYNLSKRQPYNPGGLSEEGWRKLSFR